LEQLEPVNFRKAETIDFAAQGFFLAHCVVGNCGIRINSYGEQVRKAIQESSLSLVEIGA
jgi:hypothetical protein